ncbi:MAG: RNA polymerase sigma factor, partial [Calditrichaeota bacterium]|nr:RNA polymerase sigma factor [Calditrichota bacterium]
KDEFLQHHDHLKSYMFRITTNWQDAEDLVQDTYLRAEKSLSTYLGKSSLKTWMFTIATNLAKDKFRSRQRWGNDIQDRCKESTEASPDRVAHMYQIVNEMDVSKYEFKEHIDYCFTCIGKTLEIEQQLALILKDIYEFKVTEIMQILNQTEGQVKYLLSEARKLMIEIFDNRCALVNKKGICHECSEMNHFINPKQEARQKELELKLVKEAKMGRSKKELFRLRTELVKHIDPLNSEGSKMHAYLLSLMPEHALPTDSTN